MARKKGLQPSVIKTTSPISKANIETNVLEEFKAYMAFANVKTLDEALEQSISYIMADDPEWQKEKKQASKAAKADTSAKEEKA